MGEPITDHADRDALLRYLDLKNDLDDIARKYRDLGLGVVSFAMKAVACEVYACAMLPQRYVAPPADREDSRDGATHKTKEVEAKNRMLEGVG